MALPGSGVLSLNDIQTEFGGSNPIGISEYYGVTPAIPGSGTISIDQFHGQASYGGMYGETYGFSAGGNSPSLSPTSSNRVDRFPVAAPFTTATDVGNLAAVVPSPLWPNAGRFHHSGHCSDTYGWTAGGEQIGSTADIQKFPLAAPFGTSTSAGSLPANRARAAGVSDESYGYTINGVGTPPATVYSDALRFPFAAPPASITTHASVGRSTYWTVGMGGDTYGFNAQGLYPTYTNRVDRFPFAAPPVTMTDIGNLTQVVGRGAGTSSDTYGFSVGGSIPSPTPVNETDRVDRFPNSAPFVTATDMGNLVTYCALMAGSASTSYGFRLGSNYGTNQVDRFPNSAPFVTATDVGNLTIPRLQHSGHYV